jgi:uncharacterized membrane protein
MHAELLVLRLIHVLGGVFWVGSGMFTAFFLMPALKESGPAAAQVLAGLQRRRMMVILPVNAIVTMLAGIRLMQITSGGFARDYLTTPIGKTYTVSAILAIVSFLLGVIVARPGALRLTRLTQMSASGEMDRAKLKAEMEAVQRRMAVATMFALTLLLLSAAGMAVARYM